MKMMPVVALPILAMISGACAGESEIQSAALPEIHQIEADAGMGTLHDATGADAFGNMLDHPDSRYYTVNDYYNMKSGGGLHILTHYETYQQTTEYSCGCAAALMVLHHYGVNDYNEMQICERAGADPSKGTSVEGLASFFEELGFRVDDHAAVEPRFAGIGDCEAYLIRAIDGGAPVMVDWVDWFGHWQTIIGIDTCDTASPYDDVLIMADSYDVTDHYQDGYYVVPFGRFYAMWREGPCAEKEVPYEQPFITVYSGE